MGLSVQNCRGQCYDGGNNMVGSKSGVATQIQTRNPVPSLLTVMDTLYSQQLVIWYGTYEMHWILPARYQNC